MNDDKRLIPQPFFAILDAPGRAAGQAIFVVMNGHIGRRMVPEAIDDVMGSPIGADGHLADSRLAKRCQHVFDDWSIRQRPQRPRRLPRERALPKFLSASQYNRFHRVLVPSLRADLGRRRSIQLHRRLYASACWRNRCFILCRKKLFGFVRESGGLLRGRLPGLMRVCAFSQPLTKSTRTALHHPHHGGDKTGATLAGQHAQGPIWKWLYSTPNFPSVRPSRATIVPSQPHQRPVVC